MQLDSECVEIMREVRDLVRLMALKQADNMYGVGLFDNVPNERHARDWSTGAHRSHHTRQSLFHDDAAEAAE